MREIIIIMIIVYFLGFRLQRIYYLRKKNKLITFVVTMKSRVTHYIDLPEDITRDKLVKCIVHMGEKEEDIIGVYNLLGTELEYIKGVWVEK